VQARHFPPDSVACVQGECTISSITNAIWDMMSRGISVVLIVDGLRSAPCPTHLARMDCVPLRTHQFCAPTIQ